MHPLPNARHEAFAFALASGSTPEDAYDEVGFHPNNRRSRSEALSHDPDILARAEQIRATLPDLDLVRQRYAPAFTTMPETRAEMTSWLWQVAVGIRQVNPRQWQAAKLFARINQWDIKNVKGQHSPTDLPECVRESLALLNAVQADKETRRNAQPREVHSPTGPDADTPPETEIGMGMRYWDGILEHQMYPSTIDPEALPDPLPDRSLAFQSRADSTPDAASGGWSEGLSRSFSPPQNAPKNGDLGTFGDHKSPSQPLDPQPTTPELTILGDQKNNNAAETTNTPDTAPASTLGLPTRADSTPDTATGSWSQGLSRSVSSNTPDPAMPEGPALERSADTPVRSVDPTPDTAPESTLGLQTRADPAPDPATGSWSQGLSRSVSSNTPDTRTPQSPALERSADTPVRSVDPAPDPATGSWSEGLSRSVSSNTPDDATSPDQPPAPSPMTPADRVKVLRGLLSEDKKRRILSPADHRQLIRLLKVPSHLALLPAAMQSVLRATPI